MARRGGGEGGASAYYEIADFKEGMDLRKSVLTAPAGTLRLLQNAHITPGGEIDALLPPVEVDGQDPVLGSVPALGEHTAAIRAEFGP